MLPDTINLHFTPSCNAHCHFCFARYSTIQTPCSTEEFKRIIEIIAAQPHARGPRRVNFVGGEPTIYKDLPLLLNHAKRCGLQTSMVSNGLGLLLHGLEPYKENTDMIGLSIDSIDPGVIHQTGRFLRKRHYVPDEKEWYTLASKIHRAGIRLKINTVVHRLNHTEDLNTFITQTSPEQWKIFQVTRINGQNDNEFRNWQISKNEFDDYCCRHRLVDHQGIRVVPESSDVMRNSYAIIGPHGCFVDNADETHHYSSPILEVGLKRAWSEIRFDHTAFLLRRGQAAHAQKEVFHA